MRKHFLFCLFLLTMCAGQIYSQNKEVASIEDLNAAISESTVTSITLKDNITGVTKGYTVYRDDFTFDGGNFTISYSGSGDENLLNIVGKNATVKNVTLKGSKGNGLCFVNSDNARVENVTLTDNAKGGLQIASSIVDVKGVKTSGNGWYGVGIGLSKESLHTPHFTFDETCSFDDAIPMKSESKDYLNLPEGWTVIDLQDGSGEFLLTNKDTSTKVDSYETLVDALKNPAILEIVLTKDIPDASAALVISRNDVTLDGANFTIASNLTTGEEAVPGDANLLNVLGDNVTIKNVTLKNAKGNGLCFVNAKEGTVENVTLNDNVKGGLQVASSEVSAKGIKTSGNGWYGVGIGLSQASDLDPSFTFDANCTFAETIPMKTGSMDYIPNLPEGWTTIDPKDGSGELILTNKDLSAPVKTFDELVQALQNPAIPQIQLAQDIADADSAIAITRSGVTLDGAGFSITYSGKATTEETPGSANLVNVEGSNVTVKNITLKNAIGNGLCFINAAKGTVDNVTLTGNGKGGLQVVSSEVDAKGISTSDNKWYGVGIGVSAQSSDITPTFSFDENCTFAEEIPMKTESKDYLKGGLPEGWIAIILNDENKEIILTNKTEKGDDGVLVKVKSGAVLTQILTGDDDQTAFNGILLDNKEAMDSIQLSAPLTIKSDISISAEDPTKPVTITAPADQPAFSVLDGGTLNLNNMALDIDGQLGTAALIESSGTLELLNVSITGITQAAAVKALRDDAPVSALINAKAGEALVNRVTLSENKLDNDLFITGAAKIFISNSLFYDNGNMKLVDVASADSHVSLINNTFINDTPADQTPQAVVSYSAGNVQIFNNILFSNADKAISGSGFNAKNNALTSAEPLSEATNIALKAIADVKFGTDTDFHLRSNSPLVGKGDPNALNSLKDNGLDNTQDIEGNARTTGSKINIGAFETLYTEPSGPDDEPQTQIVPELTLLSQEENRVLIGWVQIDNVDHYTVNVYDNDQKDNLIGTREYARETKTTGQDISFTVAGLNTSGSYYIEVIAFDRADNEMVKKGIVVELNTTAIESISNEVKVYTLENAIRIDTPEPVEVWIVSISGNTLYQGMVNDSRTIDVYKGIYIVRLKSDNQTDTRKVIVP